jgi:multicomponent Na+:H+ antiporter subunit G
MTGFAMLLMALGVGFLLVAAIGVIRLPDPLQRMHSATKAGTLGTALLLLGVLFSGVFERQSSGLLTILFLLITLPIGAQLLGRASYVSGAKLKGLEADPLAGELERAGKPPSA